MQTPRKLLITFAMLLLAPPAGLAAESSAASGRHDTTSTLDELNRQARARVSTSARIGLMPENAEVFHGIDGLESTAHRRVPNYLRAFATMPAAVQPLAHLVKSVLYSGAVEPETKMAMGLRIAQIYRSSYLAAHLQRFLRATDSGKNWLRALETGDAASLKPAQRMALRYGENLTRDIHGVSDEDFREVRGYFNDSQIVELTLTTCFFNHFTRLVEALYLPVEPWVFASDFTPPAVAFATPAARVGLIADQTMEWAAEQAAARPDAANQGTGRAFRLANSQRAMFLSPEIAQAWRGFGFGRREGVVSREIKLHVSFAVSMANGCRYCVLHQVQGLRRLNVSPAKLMRMKKDDSALTPRELTAVEFARLLTRDPASLTDADYAKLRAEFGEQGALELVLQTAAFAFMNRFTDGLRLPSEDEAIRVYREVYGGDFSAE
jgi:AhpD family alkylhydroperoxidase